MTTRILRAAAAALLLLTLGATAALAGGWATIAADNAAPPVPRAGEDVEYGFTVLQHGVTPAGFEDPTLRLTNTITGETFDVPAEPSGAAGHFVARFTFPSAGTWSYGIQLQQLAVETQPVTGTVLEATPTGIPLLGVVTLAVLGVALAGVRDRVARSAARARGRRRPARDQPRSGRSARIAPGVSCSWRRRANRAGRSASGTASIQRRRRASPSL